MKRVAFVALGVALGAVVAGCAAICEESSSLDPGAYGLDYQGVGYFSADAYQLTLNQDRTEVTETFQRAGKRYVLRYAVTSAVRH